MFAGQEAESWVRRRKEIALPVSEKGRRYELARGLMAERGIDCLVVCAMDGSVRHEANVRYFVGEFYKNQSFDEYVIFPKEGDPCFILTYAFRTAWAKTSWIQDVRAPEDFAGKDPRFLDDPKKVLPSLARAIVDRGYDEATIGVTREIMPIYAYQQLSKGLPKARFVDCSDLMVEARRVKSPFEIRLQEESARIGDLAWDCCRQTLREGILQHQLVAAWDYVLKLHGCEKSYELIGSAPLTPAMLRWPQHPRKIQRGDTIIVQISPCFGGYFTKMIRSFSIGKPNPKIEGMAQVCLEAHQLGASLLAPGTSFSKVTASMEGVIKKAGYRPLYRSGYASVGLDLVEISEPAASAIQLERGMVVTIHPSAVTPGPADERACYFGPGDTYVISEDGARRLSKAPQELLSIQ